MVEFKHGPGAAKLGPSVPMSQANAARSPMRVSTWIGTAIRSATMLAVSMARVGTRQDVGDAATVEVGAGFGDLMAAGQVSFDHEFRIHSRAFVHDIEPDHAASESCVSPILAVGNRNTRWMIGFSCTCEIPSMIVVERLPSRVGPVENPPSIWNAPRDNACKMPPARIFRIPGTRVRTRHCRSKTPVSARAGRRPAGKCRKIIRPPGLRRGLGYFEPAPLFEGLDDEAVQCQEKRSGQPPQLSATSQIVRRFR